MQRRDAVKLMALMAAAPTFSFACTGSGDAPDAAASAASGLTQPGPDYEPQFFTEHEFATVTLLADMIIPADERSGSASDARVPEFIDHVMVDELLGNPEPRQTALRGGLAWLDHQCLERFEGRLFVECTDAEREELLDLIAYPEEAPEELAAGVAFFNSFRDLVATGFFSSRIGVEDLGYVGNTAVEWTGCPDEVLDHIGVVREA